MSAVTLSGPLTAFQPPTSCFNEIWLNGMSDVVLGNPRDNACKPSGWRTAVQYSPALCPASYTSASGQVTTSGSVTETVIACCPSSFIADPGTFHCLSHIDRATLSVGYTFTSGPFTTVSTVAVTGQGVNAHSILVRYQSSDLSLLSADTTPSSPTTTTAAASSTSAAATPSTESHSAPTSTSSSSSSSIPSASSSQGLSTGAKAGIGVGAAIGAILLIALIYFVASRANKRKKAKTELSPYYHEDAVERTSIEQKKAAYTNPVELSSGRPDESSRSELPGS